MNKYKAFNFCIFEHVIFVQTFFATGCTHSWKEQNLKVQVTHSILSFISQTRSSSDLENRGSSTEVFVPFASRYWSMQRNGTLKGGGEKRPQVCIGIQGGDSIALIFLVHFSVHFWKLWIFPSKRSSYTYLEEIDISIRWPFYFHWIRMLPTVRKKSFFTVLLGENTENAGENFGENSGEHFC